MPLSNFSTPSPIAVALDLYVADVWLVVEDRDDTTVDVRAGDPDKPADVKAVENTRVEYDEASRTLSIVSRKPRSRFVNFSSKRPESIIVIIRLPSDSEVRGEADLGDLTADGVLGAVTYKTGLGALQLQETGPLNLRNGLGQVSVKGVSGSAEVHAGSGDIRIRAVDGTAAVSNGNGKVRVGEVTGPATVKVSNGSVVVDRALSDVTAENSNGEVRIGEVVRGKVSATTKNGSVEIGVRQGSAAWLELNTGVGRVYSEIPDADAPAAGEHVERVEIRATTKLGDVTIRRAPRLEES